MDRAWWPSCSSGYRCRDGQEGFPLQHAAVGARCRSPPGGVSAMTVANPAHGIRPSLEELVALRQAAYRRAPVRRGSVGQAGAAPSAVRGRGMEYAESREYVAGDDARHIDWKLSARTGRTQTKLFQAERERLTLLVADTAPTLFFGTRVRFKSVQAARAGAVAAWWAQRQGDRVSVLRAGSEPAVAPGGGTNGVLRVLDALVRWYHAPLAGDEGLVRALERAARLARPGTRLVVLADPLAAAAVPSAQWAALCAHHEVIVLLVVDPLEIDPPAIALPLATRIGRIALDLRGSTQRQRWQQSFAGPLERVTQALGGLRAAVHVLRSDDESDLWLGAAAAGRR